MKNYTFKVKNFVDPDNAIEVAARMGWMPECDGDSFTITFPNEDFLLVDFVFNSFE